MKQKQIRINSNAYLARSFASLKRLKGNVFIFGHSLRNEDDHVFNYLNNKSSVKNIFISIYGDKNLKDNKRILEKVAFWQKTHEYKKYPKKYYIYQAESAQVWDRKIDDNILIKRMLGDNIAEIL